MRQGRFLFFTVLLGCFLILACGDGRGAAGKDTQELPVTELPPAEEPPAEDDIPITHGVFALEQDTIGPDLLSKTFLAGISLRFSWAVLEPTEGDFQWDLIDTQIQLASESGKVVSLAIAPGTDSSTPGWLFDAGAVPFTFTSDKTKEGGIGTESERTIPVPWDPIYLEKWHNFVVAFGARYASNPTITWIRITGPMNIITIDWGIPNTPDATAKWLTEEFSYTHDKLIQAIQDTIDVFVSAFPQKALSIAIGGAQIDDPSVEQSSASCDADAFVVCSVVEYGYNTYPNQFRIQRNALDDESPVPEVAIDSAQKGVWFFMASRSPQIGFQMVGMEGANLRAAIEIGLAYETQFLEIFVSDVVNPDLQDDLEFAAESFEQ